MRTFLFRAWDTENKCMRNNVAVGLGMVEYDLSCHQSVEIMIPMQSIGARDVNYKDIYEGDLVRFNHREGYSEVFEVVYLDENNEDEYPTNPLMCCYILFNRKTKNWMDFQWDDTEDMEVIGNIYENSNLLESEEK